MEIMKVLVVSTAHITADEDKLFTGGLSYIGFSEAVELANGYLFWIGDGNSEEEVDLDSCSPGFAACVRFAWANDLSWLRFDGDGPVLEGVPTYDW